MATDLSTEFPTTADRQAEIDRLITLEAIFQQDQAGHPAAELARKRRMEIRAL
jgi:hypothetical protein